MLRGLHNGVAHTAMEAPMSDASWQKFVRVCMATLYIVGKGMAHEYGTQTGDTAR